MNQKTQLQNEVEVLKNLFQNNYFNNSVIYKNKKITINFDEYSDSPRNWSCLGKMWVESKNYNLGDKKENFENDGDIKEMMHYKKYKELEKFLKKNNDVAVFIPLQTWSYSSSDIQLRVSTTDLDGFIYATRSDILENYGKKKLNKKLIQQAELELLSELKIYNQYLEGEVYAYKVESVEKCDKGCDHFDYLDSCSGYYDVENMLGDIISIL